MTTRIIQSAQGEKYLRLLSLTARHHARLFGDDVFRFYGTSPRNPPRVPLWDKIYWLRHEMKTMQDGDVLAFWDCDVIGLEKFDLDAVVGDADFAAVINRWHQYNLGMMLWRVNRRTRNCIASIDVYGPRWHGDHEHDITNSMVCGQLRVKSLPGNYNFYRAGAAPDTALPVYVKAYHGQGADEAFARMSRDKEIYETKIQPHL